MNYKSLLYSMLVIFFAFTHAAGSDNQAKADTSDQAAPIKSSPVKQTLGNKLISFSCQVIGLLNVSQDDGKDTAPLLGDLSKVSAEAVNPQPLYKATHNWNPIYHHQVGPTVFAVIGYPYGVSGIPFDQPLVHPLTETENDSLANQTADPNATVHPANPQEQQALMLEKWCELVHQWRRLNEAPVLASEVVHSAGLTRAQIRIYQLNPQLAVDIKRTLGRIGSLNQAFDRTSRIVVRNILSGQTERHVCLEMEKQLADLESLMDRLAETNDLASIALGIGPINRSDWNAVLADPIDYSHFETQTVAKP